MDLILINDNKLKVVLTAEDMTAYALTCETIDYDNTETKRAFWDILDTAKHRTGFDAASDRVFIQVYPSRGGGCELYVTKLHSDRAKSPLPGEHVCRVSRADTSDGLTSEIYAFDSMHSLLCACRLLWEHGAVRSSSAYIAEGGDWYYLRFESRETYPAIAEYGVRHNLLTADTYIAEHCECICKDNAVEILAALA